MILCLFSNFDFLKIYVEKRNWKKKTDTPCLMLLFPHTRGRRQQPELDLLRAPDAVAAAQPVWGPADGSLGQRRAGRHLHHGLRLPQRPRAHYRDGQWARDIPAPRA